MAYFNAVLLPVADFKDRTVEYAQEKYADIAEGYCLSPTVYPHITLCQFQADDQPMIFIDGLFNPVFHEVHVRAGAGQHLGYSWVEWTVRKDDWLVQLQASVHDSLTSEGASVHTETGDTYYPHMTFCRIPQGKADDVELPMIEQSVKPWIFTIGMSDEAGQFLG